MIKKGLGRGLQALLPDAPSNGVDGADRQAVVELSIDEIRPRENQPRRFFSEEKLDELAQSIREHGVIQPIVVQSAANGYEIVAGERRWRACRRAGVRVIPAIVKEFDSSVIDVVALIENLQREDLNAIEEAQAFQRLIKDYQINADDLAKRLGKSRPYIANMVRLLKLPDEIQQSVAAGETTAGHVRALLGLRDVKKQKEIFDLIKKRGLSVRQVEEAVKKLQALEENEGFRVRPARVAVNPVYSQAEDRLRSRFGTGVKVRGQGSKGKIEIDYYSDEDFNRIIELVLGEQDF